MGIKAMDNIRAKIAEYLASHPYLRLGTVTENSTPQVHTVGYVAEGCTVYFATDRKSRKAENIFLNSAVAYTVDENYEDVMAIQGVQMEGKASTVNSESKTTQLLEMMAQKFPGLEEMPPNPYLLFIKIEPTKGYFLDNTVSFGHRSMLVF